MSNQVAPRRAANLGLFRNIAQIATSDMARSASNQAWKALKRKFTGGDDKSTKRKRSAPTKANRAGGRRAPVAASLNTRLASKKLVKRGKVGFKKTKSVKVNKVFKAKVAKSLEPKRVSAFCESRDFQYVRNELDNAQTLFYLGKGSNLAGESVLDGNNQKYDVPWFFDPLRVMDLASVAFNKKAGSSRNVAFADAGNFDVTTACPKIHVKKSWVTFQIKNNTERTYYLKLYVIAPKKSQGTLDFYTQWSQSFTDENNRFVNISNPVRTARTLDTSPFLNEAMRTNFQFSVVDVTLEPGQAFDYVLPGPQDFVYDYGKYFVKAAYEGLQKMMRTVFVTGQLDMQINYGASAAATSSIRSGQPAYNSNGTAVGGLSVEYREFYDITMPEIAGGTTKAVGAVTQLQLRQDVKVFNDYFTTAVNANDLRIDAENPNYNLNGQ